MHGAGPVLIPAAHRDCLDALNRSEKTDLELIDAINDGDAAAFEALYRRYRDWVVNLGYRFTGDSELALDVMQDTFLYLVKKFPGFRLTSQLKTFLYPAVRNLSAGHSTRGASAAWRSTTTSCPRTPRSSRSIPLTEPMKIPAPRWAFLCPFRKECAMTRPFPSSFQRTAHPGRSERDWSLDVWHRVQPSLGSGRLLIAHCTLLIFHGPACFRPMVQISIP